MRGVGDALAFAPAAEAQFFDWFSQPKAAAPKPRVKPKPPGDDLPPIVPRESSIPPPPDDRPYDNKLMRLAEILGAVHYLRELCGAQEGQIWRDQMKEILRNEGTTAVRRAKLVNSFNDGYRGYRRTYRSCTQSATLATTRFSSEGRADRRLAGPGLDLRQQRARPTPSRTLAALPAPPAMRRPAPRQRSDRAQRPRYRPGAARPERPRADSAQPAQPEPADAAQPEAPQEPSRQTNP